MSPCQVFLQPGLHASQIELNERAPSPEFVPLEDLEKMCDLPFGYGPKGSAFATWSSFGCSLVWPEPFFIWNATIF